MLLRIGLSAAMGLLIMQGAVGQQAGNPGAQATVEAAKPATLSEANADIVAPELIPKERTINEAEPCKEQHDGVVVLSLVVDASGQPHNTAVTNPKGTAQEKLAIRIVGNDTFRPGTLKGKAASIRESVQVSIAACLATKTDAAGNTTDVFRLTAQPVQTFSDPTVAMEAVAKATEAEAKASGPGDVDPKTGLYRIGNGVSAPRPLNNVEAEFSDEARRHNYSGVCLVTVVVDAKGKPQNPRVVRALGMGLDQKAVEAVMKYRFKPAMRAGVPVPVLITVEVNFRYYDRQ